MANKTTVLFSTNGVNIKTNAGNIYDYKDGIYDGRNNGNTFVRYSGQKKQKATDNLILDRDIIHIWCRKHNGQFKYLGRVTTKRIIKPRDNENTLVVDLFVEKDELSLDYNTTAEVYNYEKEGGHKFQKYKMDCFRKLNLTPIGNWCSGIMEGV